MACSENIEIALAAHREAEAAAVAEEQRLASEFGGAVGADGIFFGGLVEGEGWVVAVDGGGGGKDEPGDAVGAGSFGDEVSGVQIEQVIESRIGDAFLDADEGGEVNNRRGAGGGDEAVEGVAGGDIRLVEREGWRGEGALEIGAATGAKVIDAADREAGREELVDGVAANKAGRAGDKNRGHGG